MQGKSWLRSYLTIFALAGLASCSQQITYPAPKVTSLSPTQITAGQPGFTLTVTGSDFTPASAVLWNGAPRSSVFVNTTTMTAQIQAGDIANPAFVLVTVFTPQPGGGTATPPLTFTIAPVTNPIPQINSLSPSGVFAGAPQFALDVTGTNFVAQSIVTVNGSNRTTAFISSTDVRASIPASDVVNAGSLQIAVVNPPQNSNPNIPPGGGISNILNLAVSNPVPIISSLAPTSVGAGSGGANLAVTGSNFVPNSVILVNGTPKTTSFTSGNTVVTQLTAGDLAAAGENQVQVTNPAPGGGKSGIVAFAVVPTIAAGLPVLVDAAPDGSQANNGICGGLVNCQNGTLGLTLTNSGPSMSSTGQIFAFASISNNLVTGQASTASQIFLRDTCLGSTCTPVTSILTTAAGGGPANGPSSQPSLDGTAAHAVFTSTATNLTTTPPVTNNVSQVYWRAACTGGATSSTGSGCTAATSSSSAPAAILVSISADGLSAGNGPSSSPVISSDGEFVTFVSLATNLVASNSQIDGVTPQVYVRTMCNPTTVGGVTTTSCTPTTFLVSSPDGVTPGNGASTQPSIASSGKFVSFTSQAKNLGPSAPNPAGAQEIFEQSECYAASGCAQTLNLISTPDAGATAADNASNESSISDDGRFVAFASTATNLKPGIGPTQQIYLYDTCNGATSCTPSIRLVSTPDGTSPAISAAEYPSVNRCGAATSCESGQFVAFASKASNLVGGTANGIENIFVRNTCSNLVSTTTACTPTTALASHAGGTSPSPSNGDSLVPVISGDGHTVGFLSFSSNLVPRDNNNLEDIFLGSTSF